jgi:hypothetical protein
MRISLPQNTFLVLFGAIVAHGAAAAVPQPPIPHAHGRAQPRIVPSGRAVLFTGHTGTTSPWQVIANAPSFNPGAMLLLTDGTLLVQDQGVNNGGTNAWWKLTPDITGSYVNGTWSQVASLIAKYQPLYFADAVLPDGRVIIEGGEYNLGKEVWTNQGAIYDPVANSWTPVKPPKGSEWSRIGDGPGTVLANGTFMLGASGYSGTTAEALLTESSLKWKATGSGKADGNGEEGWSLLPNGDVLTVDTNDGTNTEIYSPATKAWTSAGGTPASLINGGEVGPQVLQPDGTVFAVGATGANAVYASGTGTWAAAPSFPVIGGAQYDVADGASAVLPDGNVLVDASPGVYQTPVHFWEFDGTNLTQVADTPNAPNLSSFDGFMIVLPTGQVMFNDRVGSIEFYNSTGAPKAAWLPVITSVPTTLTHGSSYTVSGKQLGGLTQAAAYGDDYQAATNYPLVRLTVTATSHVFYARTSGFTAMGVAPAAKSSASFLVPAGIETGAATLQVVANGIASKPVSVTID